MYQGNVAHTGRSTFAGITNQPVLLWKQQLIFNDWDTSSGMSMGADGTVYFSKAGKLFAMNDDGSLKWMSSDLPGYSSSSTPALGANNTIYWGTNDSFGQFDMNGTLISGSSGLTANLFFGGSPVIAPDGNVYATHDALWAFSADARVRWVYDFEKSAHAAPSIGSDGTIYVAGKNGNLQAFTAAGELKWSVPAAVDGHTPVLADDGTIYITNFSGTLSAYSPEGTLQWEYIVDGVKSSANLLTEPALASDGTIYFGTSTPSGVLTASTVHFFAINPDGTKKWQYDIPHPAQQSTGFYIAPLVDRDNNVYTCVVERECYAFDKDGNLLWRYKTSPRIAVSTTPLLVRDHLLWILDGTGALYALGDSEAPFLQADQLSLNSSTCGITQPFTRSLELSSSQTTVTWNASLINPPEGVSLANAQGTTPATLTITIDPSMLKTSSYQTSLRIATNDTSIINPAFIIPITIANSCELYIPIINNSRK